jgi:hypothetical protein
MHVTLNKKVTKNVSTKTGEVTKKACVSFGFFLTEKSEEAVEIFFWKAEQIANWWE